eukprot:TRINITY_DN5642_c0_g1_i4.p1 TRINITY_DN5642_c0_g1~~TRINITY_DN5642_c0_g1_i4.p1  ORF type:complete len:864 (+),score=295.38 TRINITY_DN5642_c0_g1_i4:234-2825(+)
MGFLGIRNLTILLCVVLVITTGMLIGVISHVTSASVLSNTRDASDANINLCLSSGERDVKNLASKYLSQVAHAGAHLVEDFTSNPVKVATEVAGLIATQLPTSTSSDSHLDTQMRSLLWSRMAGLAAVGGNELAYIALTDPTTPGTGGTLLYFRPPKPEPEEGFPSQSVAYVVETRRADGSFGQNTTHLSVSDTSPSGLAAGQGIPCDLSKAASAGAIGECVQPASWLMSSTFQETYERALGNSLRSPAVNVNGACLAGGDCPHYYAPAAAHHSFVAYTASVTVGHPAMPSLGPNHNGQVGMVSVSFVVAQLSHMLEHEGEEMPAGSLIYVVEKNPWTDVVGGLIATSDGSAEGMTESVHIANHTVMEDGVAVPSIISHHGRYILGDYDGGYEELAHESHHEMQEWATPTKEVYWTGAIEVVDSNLEIYLVVMCPRSSLLAALDVSTATINTRREDTKEQSNEDEKRGLTLMIGVTVAVTIVQLVVAVFLTHRIVAPLQQLSGEMHAIAHMDLESVDAKRPISMLSEVGSMQESFLGMLDRLIEYRNYMPQSLLAAQSDTEETEEGTAVDDLRARTQSRSLSETASRASSAFGGGTAMAKRKLNQDVNLMLRRKTVTVVALNVRNFLNAVRELTNHEISAMHSEMANTVLQAITQGKGLVENMMGDRVIASFNAFGPCAEQRTFATRAAYRAKGELQSSGLSLSYAVATGDARVGSLGCSRLKKMTILSNIMPWVVVMETYNKVNNNLGVADSFVVQDGCAFDFRCLGGVSYSKRLSKPICVYEVTAEAEEAEMGEWMYQLQQTESAMKYTHWNNTFRLVVEGKWDKARESLEHLVKQQFQGYRELQCFIEEMSYTPETITFA